MHRFICLEFNIFIINSRWSTFYFPIHAWVLFATNLKLSSIVNFLFLNSQKKRRLMHRSEFIESITTWLWEPLLIRPPGWLPLNNFSSIISTLSSDIEAKPIESTFNHNAFPLFLKMPSLIPSFVLLPLY